VVSKTTLKIRTGLLLVFSVFLMGMEGTGTGDVGQDSLAARQRELQERIEVLRSEQDQLLFQKQFSTMDSRYLVLDLARGRGQLKYRSRVFLDFTFGPLPKRVIRTIPRGARAVTRKFEESGGRFALSFGKAFILRTNNATAPGLKIPQLIVSPKEMRSIFFALEEGSLAYILR